MAQAKLYYSVEKQEFVPESEALEIAREAITNDGNMDAVTHQVVEYGFDAGLMSNTKIVKFVIKAGDPARS